MKLEYLNDFIVFSQTLNYSATAKKLYTTQPSLSNHIRSLEKELDVVLVTPGPHPTLTAAGRELVEEATALLDRYQILQQKVKDAETQANDLTILVNNAPMAALENLHRVNVAYYLQNPNFYATTMECIKDTAWEALRSSSADVVACFDCPLDPDKTAGLAFITLPNVVNARLGLWMSRNHPLAQIEHLTWDHITKLNHPLPAGGICQLWANTTMQMLRNHNVSVTGRAIASGGARFFFEFSDEEVQLFDNGFERNPGFDMSANNRLIKYLEGPDSESLLYLAYNPKHMSNALVRYLTFIEDLRTQLAEKQEL